MMKRNNTGIRFIMSSIGLGLLLFLAGCEASATPLPAVLPPTPTDAPLPTLPPPLRYAFSANTAGYVEDLALIRATGLVDQLTDNNLDETIIAGYDVVVTYGTVEAPGWIRSPITPNIALLLNTSLPPLDNPDIQMWVQRALNPQAIVSTLAIPGAAAAAANPVEGSTARNALANAGYPDGVHLILGFRTFPGAGLLAEQWAAAGFHITPVAIAPDMTAELFQSQRAHVLLVIWTTPEEKTALQALGDAAPMIDLYALPISYRANPQLTLTFTSSGFPMAAR